MCQEYNGWINYQTWYFYTWISGEEKLYNKVLELKREEDIKIFAEEYLLENETNYFKQGIFQSYLDNVEWSDIFEALHEI